MLGGMPDLTRLLEAAEAGDPAAAAELLPLVYDELRKLAASRLAAEKPGQTLQATALVHEAYLRLVGGEQVWNGRGHFFAAAAEAMRRILVERARGAAREKRGGDWRRVDFEELDAATSVTPTSWSPWTTRSTGWQPWTGWRANWSSSGTSPAWASTGRPRPWACRRPRRTATGRTPGRG
jgi:DNA-directed RNA polymerase specialized sigma24 family protein